MLCKYVELGSGPNWFPFGSFFPLDLDGSDRLAVMKRHWLETARGDDYFPSRVPSALIQYKHREDLAAPGRSAVHRPSPGRRAQYSAHSWDYRKDTDRDRTTLI